MTEEWESPADVEFEDPNDNLLVNLDVSNAEIYPTNMNINANNVQIEYDSNSGEYFAKHTYSHPVTKAEFTFDIQNSTLPQNIPVVKYWKRGGSGSLNSLSSFSFNNSGNTININLSNGNCLITIYEYNDSYLLNQYIASGATTREVDNNNWYLVSGGGDIIFCDENGNRLFRFLERSGIESIWIYKSMCTFNLPTPTNN